MIAKKKRVGVLTAALKDSAIFDPPASSWTRGRDMARARWYPTATSLPDGRVLVVSGDNRRTGRQPGRIRKPGELERATSHRRQRGVGGMVQGPDRRGPHL